jgi:hypothetical protein
MPEYVEFIKLENGDLEIKLNERYRQDVEDIAHNEHWGDDTKFIELINYQISDHEWVVLPENYVALNSTTLLSDEVGYDPENEDEDVIARVGRIYKYNNYQVFSEVEQILQHGSIILTGYGGKE